VLGTVQSLKTTGQKDFVWPRIADLPDAG
jgi:hypothetical protein